MIQTILFATDLCVFTPFITQHVGNLAHHCGAKIVVLHVVEPLGTLGRTIVKSYLPKDASDHLSTQGLDALIGSIRERVVAVMADEFLDTESGMAQVSEIIVEAGKPADLILQYAQDRAADLIVMGSRGLDASQGISLGSVASRVLQHARIPVYLVPLLSQKPDLRMTGSSAHRLG